MILFLLACAVSSPPSDVSVTSSSPMTVETVIVRVPSNCAHVLLDVVSGDRVADMTVACFDHATTRTYFANERIASVGTSTDPTRRERLIIEFVPRHDIHHEAFARE